MRHLLLILPAILVAYIFWQLATPKDRRTATGFIARHGVRLAGLLALVFLLVAAAAYIPSPNIL